MSPARTRKATTKVKERRWNLSDVRVLQSYGEVKYGLGEKGTLREVSRGE